ncbi:MAG: nucleotidyltransferase family protein [Hyphomicrobiaceae bacterium]|nr:nucleotidyltransferase family protein [Hyphomicrobiaceae bacterium]
MTQSRPETIDTAMVLAAGLGTRMRPLTERMPKPMVPLAGRPLIDHALDRLAAAGVRNAVVNVHYKADQIEQHLKGRERPAITISDERDALLDTGGGLSRALPLLGDRPFIIHNSDTAWIEGVGANLDRLIAAWDADQMDSLLLLALASRSLGYAGSGDFTMDAEGRLKRRQAPFVAPFVFTGVSIAHPRIFDDAPSGPYSLNRLWNRAIERGRLFGIRLEGWWMHVGTPEALTEAEEWLADADKQA